MKITLKQRRNLDNKQIKLEGFREELREEKVEGLGKKTLKRK